MLKAISTYVHIKERLHPGILDRLAKGGAQGIEVFAMRGHFDYTNSQQVREIGSWFRSQEGVALNSLHAPIYAGDDWGGSDMIPLDVAGGERKDRVMAMDEIKRAIEVAEVATFGSLVLHIGVSGELHDERKFEHALTSVEHLRAFAKPLGVRLLLENIPNELTAPEKLVQLIQTLHYDDMGICLDLGHAHLSPGVESAIETMKPLIREVHVHDNHGAKDEHLWPGGGTIDWKQTMESLRTAPQVPAMVLEIEGDPQGNPEYGKTVPGKMAESWNLLGL